MEGQPLATYLKTYRKRTGLSQEDVAFLLGALYGTHVSRHELNEVTPNLHNVLMYECVLGATVRELFEGKYEELRQEMREMEGDPHQKARVRSVQRAIARKRMMSAVPTASVVVTNPTHYAVALEYRDTGMRAPRVVAKGAGVIAQKIRELAAEHDVPRLEAPPLARALWRHAEVGDEIPPALYTVVAQVLAYVYRVEQWRQKGGRMPDAPSDLSVPPGLDPAEAAA